MLKRLSILKYSLLCFLCLVLLVQVLVLVTENTSAEDEIDCRYKGGYGGSYYDVAYDGEYLFAAHVQGLSIFDVSNSSNPEKIGFIHTPGMARGVAVVGNYAYIADHDNGLVIVDISDKTDPQKVGGYDTFSYAYDVAVLDNYVYIADYGDGLIIIDITNQTDPKKAGEYDVSNIALGVAVVDNYAYLAEGGNGLTIIDITDKNDPQRTGGYDTTDAYDVTVVGDYAYVAGDDDGLVIVDVTDKADPQKTGSYDTSSGSALDVAVVGNYAYIAFDGFFDSYLTIVDVTDKNDPQRTGSYEIESGIHGVAVFGDYAYVAGEGNGLVIVNITDKERPRRAGGYSASSHAWGVAVVGDYAYVADGEEGFVIVNITDKNNLERTGGYDSSVEYRDVVVVGDYAYVACGLNGFSIFNITNKTDPKRTGGRDTSDAYDIVVVGNYAYVADGNSGLDIFDIADKTKPEKTGKYDTSGKARGVAVVGDYAYVADGEGGLVIVDITDKTDPQWKGSYDTSGKAYDVAVVGDYAYIADDDNGLVVVDISDKTNPKKVGGYDTSMEEARGVTVVGNYAFVVDSDYSGNRRDTCLVIVDVTDKANPQEVGRYESPGSARNVVVVGDLAYIADEDNGLLIVKMDLPKEKPTSVIHSISPSLAVVSDTIEFKGYAICRHDRTIQRHVWSSSIDGELHNSNECNFSTADLSLGRHSISLKSQDSEGNWGEEASQTLVVTERPEAFIDSISHDPALDTDTVELKGHATDDGTIKSYIWSSDIDGELYKGSSPDITINDDRDEDFEDGSFELATGGDADWMVTDSDSNSGDGSVVSGNIGHSQESWLEMNLTGPGTISFYWKVSSEDGSDRLALYFNGEFVYEISGEVDWKRLYTGLSSGITNVRWVYQKNAETSEGEDVGYLDDIRVNSYLSLSVGAHNLSFMAMDNHGVWSEPDTTILIVNSRPEATILELTPSPGTEGDKFSFEGEATDDGAIQRYVWFSDLDGELWNSTVESDFNTSLLSNGTHNITFRVEDNYGIWSENATATLFVNGKPGPRIITAPRGPTLLGQILRFEGKATDDGEIEAYVWCSSEDGVLYQGPESGFNCSNLSLGTHEISFRVRDGYGLFSEWVNVTVIVHEKPLAKIDEIEPEIALAGKEISFNGEGEDDGTIIRCVWHSSLDGELYNGTVMEFVSSTLFTGTHSISFKVQDNHGVWSNEVTEALVVHQRPTAEIISVSTDKALEGQEVMFTGEGTDDGTIALYVWKNGDDEIYNGTDTSFTNSTLETGNHQISLLVQDNNGAWSEPATAELLVHARPTVEVPEFEKSSVIEGTPVQFTAQAEDDNGIVLYVWRSSLDGELYNGSEASFNSENLSVGKHVIYLRVQDEHGAWSDEANGTLEVKKETKDEDESFLFQNVGPLPVVAYLGLLAVVAVVLVVVMKGRDEDSGSQTGTSFQTGQQAPAPPQTSYQAPPAPVPQYQQPSQPQAQQAPAPQYQPPAPGNWSCASCGKEVPEKYVFCLFCGTKR